MPPAPVPVPAPIKVPQVFAQALELHKQGRLTEAEQFYSEVLAHRPDHFDALQMLSVIKLAKGQPAEALRLISEAMRMRRPSPQILVNHGMILHALDRSEEALACFDAALKQKSKFAEAHNNRALVLFEQFHDGHRAVGERVTLARRAQVVINGMTCTRHHVGRGVTTNGADRGVPAPFA